MKTRICMIAMLLIVFFALSSGAFAKDYKRDGYDDCPVRILAYVVHPIGVAVEYTITRPIHWFTKQTQINKLTGSENKYDDTSFKWE